MAGYQATPYAAVLLLLNCFIPLLNYFLVISDDNWGHAESPTDESDPFSYPHYRVMLLVLLRSGVFGLAALHSRVWVRYRGQDSIAAAVIGADCNFFKVRVIASLGGCLASGFFIYSIVYSRADEYLGFAMAPEKISSGSTFHVCLSGSSGGNRSCTS
eukprot:2391436-Prymnesium_polylepis.4